MSNRDFASKQLNKIQNRILDAARAANRDPSEITLIGASKQQSSQRINEFYASGQRSFGENYLQEALLKQAELTDLDIDWHFIGKLQSNKCKAAAQHFDWVQTVDRLKIAQRLAQFRSSEFSNMERRPLNVLIQLNIDQEDSKAGVSLQAAPSLCAEICELGTICLRGFMLIPKPARDLDQQRRPFAQARHTLEKINQSLGITLDTLSMGMSNDLEAAISEGATMIRVGTDLFGPRS